MTATEVDRVGGKIEIIRIYHKCEDGIEKSIPRITDWHHEIYQMMANSDPNSDHEGQIFFIFTQLMDYFSFSTLSTVFLYWKNIKNIILGLTYLFIVLLKRQVLTKCKRSYLKKSIIEK